MIRLLVVDDDPSTLASLSRAFRMAGYEAVVCDNATRAIALLKSERFDLVFSDVVMPGIDGFELLRRVKGGWPGVKVIVLTGYARRQSIHDFLLYGADEYLAKPFQVHELLAAVDRVTSTPTRA